MPTNFGWRTARARVAGLLLTLILAACGGGGGGKDATPAADGPPAPLNPGATATLSGVLNMGEAAAVDSDTNDPNQTNRASNNDVDSAQALSTPLNLVGTVNLPGEGKDGYNKTNGDKVDYYKLTLQEGQVVELEFAADPGENDLDLFVGEESTAIVSESIGLSSNECMRISRSGAYYVAVAATNGASLYNLRIESPGNARSCDNTTKLADTATPAGELIAQAVPASTTSSSDRAQPQGLAVHSLPHETAGLTQQRQATPGGPMLLKLPEGHAARLQGLARLHGQSSFKRAAALTQAAVAAQQSAQPANPFVALMDTVAYAKALQASGQYKYVSLNYRFSLSQVADQSVGAFPPSDTEYNRQRWHYEQINLPAAMERLAGLTTQPSRRPLVAVIDSGIMSDHPDLHSKIEHGYSFISINGNGDGNVPDPDDPSRPDPDTGETPGFHGSHVAGTIAARTFDNYGAAGIAPMARLMPLRVFNPANPGAKLYDIIYAMAYAAGLTAPDPVPPRKADIINMSLGSNMACPPAYQQAIDEVRKQGVIIVVATGNSAHNDLGEPVAVAAPANCNGVVSVGALDGQRRQSSYSQSGGSGQAVRVSAPGGDVTATRRDLIFSSVAIFTPDGRRIPGTGPSIGTSMATPHVAGVIALMKYAYPGLTPALFDAWLANGELTDDVGAPGPDAATGYGVINARKAVDRALAEAKAPGQVPQGQIIATPFSLDFGAQATDLNLVLGTSAKTTDILSSPLAASSTALSISKINVDARTGLGTYSIHVNRALLAVGTQFLQLTAQTSGGTTLSIPVTVVRPDPSGTARRGADYGPVYVIALDANNLSADPLDEAMVHASNGQYTWQLRAPLNSEVYVVAGTDLNHNGFICDAGEPCGAYPLLSNELTKLTLTRDLAKLNFALYPMGTGNATVQALGVLPQPDKAGSLGPIKLRGR